MTAGALSLEVRALADLGRQLTAERARVQTLTDALEAALKVLRDLERDEDGVCPWCCEYDPDDIEGEGEGHSDDCALATALQVGQAAMEGRR